MTTYYIILVVLIVALALLRGFGDTLGGLLAKRLLPEKKKGGERPTTLSPEDLLALKQLEILEGEEKKRRCKEMKERQRQFDKYLDENSYIYSPGHISFANKMRHTSRRTQQ